MLGEHDNGTEEKETHYATIMHKGQEYLNTTGKRQKNHRQIDLRWTRLCLYKHKQNWNNTCIATSKIEIQQYNILFCDPSLLFFPLLYFY